MPTSIRYVGDLPTPSLLVDLDRLDANITTMAARWPGTSLRPHVKAFKSTALAARLAANGHTGFCCATVKEITGMARAGLGTDLLLANEVVDPVRLAVLAALVDGGARITVAVDSDFTVAAVADAGLSDVLIDVNVGLPRCGCPMEVAGPLADLARSRGLTVRGVMGYEGHLMGVDDRAARTAGTQKSMSVLSAAHGSVGGEVVSGGGTGTWDCNDVITELQAGSYTLMDTYYRKLNLPFTPALSVLGTVVSTNPQGYAVADVGLKALGMDHGDPTITAAAVWFCSDEHITYAPEATPPTLPRIGDRVEVWPAHVDPTVAYHEHFSVIRRNDPAAPIDDAEVVDEWPIDLRGW